MSDKIQLTFEDDPVYQHYEETFELIKKGEFEKALSTLEAILEKNVAPDDIYPTMKCLKFWCIRSENIKKHTEGEKRASYIRKEWEVFEQFLIKKNIVAEKATSRIKHAVFNEVIDNYIKQFQTISVLDAEILISISECFLLIKEYKKAKDTLLYAKKFKKRDSRILSYLGECFHFLKDEMKSLAYFREAFFKQPMTIDLDKLETPLIRELVKRTIDNGFNGKEVNLWLPIYAAIENKFYVKRKLNEREFENLQKRIYEYEIQYEIQRKGRNELEPILINHYIFLMDFINMIRINSNNSDETVLQNKNILRKIKNINDGVYTHLRKHYE